MPLDHSPFMRLQALLLVMFIFSRPPLVNGQEGFCIGGLSGTSVTSVSLVYYRSGQYTQITQFSPRNNLVSGTSIYLTLDLPISNPSPAGEYLTDGEQSTSVAGLGVSLAQAVADVVGHKGGRRCCNWCWCVCWCYCSGHCRHGSSGYQGSDVESFCKYHS